MRKMCTKGRIPGLIRQADGVGCVCGGLMPISSGDCGEPLRLDSQECGQVCIAALAEPEEMV